MWDFTLHLYSNTENVEGEASSSTDNMLESIATLLEMLRFTYSETIGKWPIADKAFGINYFMRKQVQVSFLISHCELNFYFRDWRMDRTRHMQGDLAVASVYGGSGCVELKGPEVVDELQELLRLLTLCMLFSKKSFPDF